MRLALVALLLATSLAVAGCAIDPEESTAPPEESTLPPDDEAPPPPAEPTAPTGDGIVIGESYLVGEPTSAVEPTPEPAAQPEPAPAPAAPPPPPPAPEPEPAPAPQPAPPPAAQPPPEPTPAPPPAPPPQPQPEPEPEPAWPREGSTVAYRISTVESYPGTDGGGKTTTVEARWTYRDGDWHGVCEGTTRETLFGNTTTRDVRVTFEASDPPHWPPFNTLSPGPVGSTVTSWLLKYECEIMSRDARYAGMADGQHVATDFDTGEPDDYSTRWDADTGLVQTWSWSQRNTTTGGSLLART